MANIKYEYTFTLVKAATGKGNDRYASVDETWTGDVYFPRDVTRGDESTPVNSVKMTISASYIPNATRFKLKKRATGNGGDRYTSEVEDTFNVYVMQDVSRVGGEPLDTLYIACARC